MLEAKSDELERHLILLRELLRADPRSSTIPAEMWPDVVGRKIAEIDPGAALRGARQAVAELLPLVAGWSDEQIKAFDVMVLECGGLSLLHALALNDKVIGRVLRRGRIKSEDELERVKESLMSERFSGVSRDLEAMVDEFEAR